MPRTVADQFADTLAATGGKRAYGFALWAGLSGKIMQITDEATTRGVDEQKITSICIPEVTLMAMVKPLFAATVASILCCGPAFAADMVAQLDGDEITKELIGHKFKAVIPKRGVEWHGIYNTDGTVRYGGRAGAWRLNGDLLCGHAISEPEICVMVYKLGDGKLQFRQTDGSKGVLVTLE